MTARVSAWGPVGWMAGAAGLGWMAATAIGGGRINPEALLGVLGPLASATLSWLRMAHTFAASPDRLTGVMVQALAVKMLGFGMYVGGLIAILDLRPVPFVVSLAGAFITLHVMEALFLRRLLRDGAAPRGARAERYDGSITR